MKISPKITHPLHFDKKRAVLHNGLLKIRIRNIYEGCSAETFHMFSHDRPSMKKDVKAALMQWFQQCSREFVVKRSIG
jgi:hypothetical protein